jgi:CBS domain-containing protein
MRTNERGIQNIDVLAIELGLPLVLDGSTTVDGVIQAMRDRHLGYSLITDEGKLAGIFTERDVLRSVLEENEVLQQPVSKLMTPAPVCVLTDATVWRVVSLMQEGGFRQIPVVDAQQRVVACVRHKDVAEYLVNHFARHILNLPPDPQQLATTPEGA